MDCPKCGHSQPDTIKCESCGVYFAKLAPLARAPRATLPPTPPSSGFSIGTLALVAVATGAVVFYFVRRAPSSEAPTAATALSTILPTAVPPGAGGPPVVSATAGAPSAGAVVNSVETAQSATVFIRTAWGLGSGFIIDSDCHVVTNRHVVETDGARVAANFEHTPEAQTSMAAARQRLAAEIYAAQLHRHVIANQPGTNLEQMQLDEQIRTMQQAFANLPQQVDAQIAEKVNEGDRSGFSVTLPNGTHYDALHAQLSGNADLALIHLPADHCPFITPQRGAAPRVGERVYTIGNPSGLTYTVTTGVVSGFRELNGKDYVQTDAPINPGNSGGPLINEQGHVIGINSMVMRGVTGIGFAIPIEAVYTEFPELGTPP
jgi:serine protease Do